ncbi:Uncharacterised protein [Mycobacteroides abscessus subsp. massiliense]|nr:Uncharacterised protein [Mycobacteroides abscessus subsp. massiliense]
MVVGEHLLGRLQKLRRQQVGKRNGNTTGGPHRGGLEMRQAQSAGTHHRAQRLRYGGDDAEVGAGAHHHDRTGRAQSPHRITQALGGSPHRVERRHVVCADHDHGSVRRWADDRHGIDLCGQSLGGGAGYRFGGQADSLA